MNQDFVLLLTPANARRLLRLQQSCNMTIPDELVDLAQQDTITDVNFDSFVCPANPTKIAITQFLLDCKLRGIIQQNYHPTFDEMALMNAVRLGKPTSVTIFTNRADVWKNASKAFFLDDITKTYRHFHMTGEEIDARRSGVLIIDNDALVLANKLRDFGNEFAQTICFDAMKGWENLVPWPIHAKGMFPTMPTPLFPRMVMNVQEAYNRPLHMFAPLYNVCLFPELITDETIVEQLTDKQLHSRLQGYKQTPYME